MIMNYILFNCLNLSKDMKYLRENNPPSLISHTSAQETPEKKSLHHRHSDYYQFNQSFHQFLR